MIYNKLKPLIRDTEDFTQMGYLPQIVTRDEFYTIQLVIVKIFIKVKGFCMLYVDFRKAFDTLTRAWLNFALREQHVQI